MLAPRTPYTQFRDELLPVLEDELRGSLQPIKVLEAGGGSATFLSELSVALTFTTVDISPDQLAKNNYADEKILADIEEFDYGDRHFKVIVCYDILEHLKHPERALARLVPVLQPGGLMVVKGPIPQSMQGLVTTWTPHWFHVLFYRWIWRSSNAGMPGYAPFQTEHASAARPEAIRSALKAAGLEELKFLMFPTHSVKLKQRSSLIYGLFRMAGGIALLFTAGRYGSMNSDFALICRKPNRS
jgi:ubiquinone/menaquinone biosynthesis C-methylase UbiE